MRTLKHGFLPYHSPRSFWVSELMVDRSSQTAARSPRRCRGVPHPRGDGFFRTGAVGRSRAGERRADPAAVFAEFAALTFTNPLWIFQALNLRWNNQQLSFRVSRPSECTSAAEVQEQQLLKLLASLRPNFNSKSHLVTCTPVSIPAVSKSTTQEPKIQNTP